MQNTVELPHVYLQGLLGGGLPSHAVAAAANGYGALVCFYGGHDLGRAFGSNNATHQDGVELRNVVHNVCGILCSNPGRKKQDPQKGNCEKKFCKTGSGYGYAVFLEQDDQF